MLRITPPLTALLLLNFFFAACSPEERRVSRLTRESHIPIREDSLVLLQWPRDIVPLNDSVAGCTLLQEPSVIAFYNYRNGGLERLTDISALLDYDSLSVYFQGTDTAAQEYKAALQDRKARKESLLSLETVQQLDARHLFLAFYLHFPDLRKAPGHHGAPDTLLEGTKSVPFTAKLNLSDLRISDLRQLPLLNYRQSPAFETPQGYLYQGVFYAARFATSHYRGPILSCFSHPAMKRCARQPGIVNQYDEKNALTVSTFFPPSFFRDEKGHLLVALRTKVYDVAHEKLLADFHKLLPDMFALTSVIPVSRTHHQQWVLCYINANDYNDGEDNTPVKRALIDLSSQKVCYRDSLETFRSCRLDDDRMLTVTRSESRYYFDIYQYQ